MSEMNALNDNQLSEEILAKLYPEKFCPGCQLTKLRDDFNRKTSNKTGLQSYCRQCQQIENGVPHRKRPKKGKSVRIKCLSCRKFFNSSDKKLNRLCDLCKGRRHYGEDDLR